MSAENTKKLSKMQKEILKTLNVYSCSLRKLSIKISEKLGKRGRRDLLDEAEKKADSLNYLEMNERG